MQRGGRENRKGHAGAARSAPITASDVEKLMQDAAPSRRRGRSSANDGGSSSWHRAADVGDTVQWDGQHSSVPAGSPEAMASQGGIVQAVEGHFVLVARPKDRGHSSEPYRVPKAALTGRSTGRAQLCSPAPQAQRLKRQRSSTGSTPSSTVKDGDSMAAASATNDWELGGEHQEDGGWSDGGPGEDEEGELDRLREENRQLREENHKLRQQKWSSKSYHKTVGSKKLDGADTAQQQLQATITKLQAELQESRERLQSHAPLEKQQFSLKSNTGTGRGVPDNLRDLIVDYSVKDGIGTNKVFDVLRRTLTALGAEVTDAVKNQQDLVAHCLVERSIILQDDQTRRMAEAVRCMYGRDELEVRDEDWDDGDKRLKQVCWNVNDSDHKKRVMDQISPWLHDPKYKPEHLGRYKQIEMRGPDAESLDDFKTSLCAMLYLAVDGTSHAR